MAITRDHESRLLVICEDGTVKRLAANGDDDDDDNRQLVDLIKLHGGSIYYKFIATAAYQRSGRRRVFVNDYGEPKIEVIETSSIALNKHIITSAITKFNTSLLSTPAGVAVDSKGRLILCDYGSNRVLIYSSEELIRSHADLSLEYKFEGPWVVAVDHMDNIFIGEWSSGHIVCFDEDGKHLNTFTTKVMGIHGITVTPNGCIYVHQYKGGVIEEIKIS